MWFSRIWVFISFFNVGLCLSGALLTGDTLYLFPALLSALSLFLHWPFAFPREVVVLQDSAAPKAASIEVRLNRDRL